MRIEFYHIDAFELPVYEPIWRALRAAGVDAHLVAVPGKENAAAGDWFNFDTFTKYCDERHLPYATTIDPQADVAITTQNSDILRDYHGLKVRVMYGPILYPNAWGLQPHTAKTFDAVLTHSQLYSNYFSRWASPSQLPVIGYPRYDDYFSGKLKRDEIRKRFGITSTKPVVVFMPTWENNTGFDLFFPALLQLTSSYHILLRPHHCTLRMEPARMQKLYASGLTILDNALELAEICKAADVIIADVRSGGLFETVMCDIPAVGMVIDPAELSGWLQHYRIGSMVSLCEQPSRLAHAIEEALTSEAKAIARAQWAEQYVAYRDGTAAMQAARAIIKLV